MKEPAANSQDTFNSSLSFVAWYVVRLEDQTKVNSPLVYVKGPFGSASKAKAAGLRWQDEMGGAAAVPYWWVAFKREVLDGVMGNS